VGGDAIGGDLTVPLHGTGGDFIGVAVTPLTVPLLTEWAATSSASRSRHCAVPF
jgi:hypothetical protein